MNTTEDEVPLKIRSVIDQLVRQQFFQSPNYVIDRTNREKVEVKGSDIVLLLFSDFLFNYLKDAKGTDPQPYISALLMVMDKLQLEEEDLTARFEKKAGSFLREGLASETILIITSVSTILESIDARHYHTLLDTLRSSFLKMYDVQNPEESFNEGIKRLGETADANFSLLLNLIKITDLAKLFGGALELNPQVENRIRKNVVQKLMTEGQ